MFDEVGLLIIKLFILGAVSMEAGQELDELVLVAEEDLQDWPGLLGVRYKYLPGKYLQESIQVNIIKYVSCIIVQKQTLIKL